VCLLSRLRHAIERCAVGQLAEDFLRDRFLRRCVSFGRMGRDHDHTQLDLLLGREFRPVFGVVIGNSRGGNNRSQFDVFAAHRLDDNALFLVFLEFGQRIILRLQRLDKGLADRRQNFPG